MPVPDPATGHQGAAARGHRGLRRSRSATWPSRGPSSATRPTCATSASRWRPSARATRRATASTSSATPCRPVTFTPDEAAVLGLARRVWHAEGAAAADRALRKLEASGVAVDSGALAAVEPRLIGGEQAYGPARRGDRAAPGGHLRPPPQRVDDRPEPPPPALGPRQPARPLVRRRPRPRPRRAPRAFRLDRIVGPVVAAGPGRGLRDPDGRRRRVAGRATPSTRRDADPAVVRVRDGRGHELRRRAPRLDRTRRRATTGSS